MDFRLQAHKNLPESVRQGLAVLPKDQGLAGMTTKTQESHHFNLSEYPSYLPFRNLFGDAGIRCVRLVPLISSEDVVGLLMLTAETELKETAGLPFVYSMLSKELGDRIRGGIQYRQIQEQFERQRALVESLPGAVYSRTVDGQFLYASPRITDIVGYEPREFHRNRSLWLSIIHPDDKKEVLIQQANIHEMRDLLVNEYRVLPKGKAEYRWIVDMMSLIRDTQGAVTTLHGIIRDISDIKNSDGKELHENVVST
jgi:PAS domain S-box-containing protein